MAFNVYIVKTQNRIFGTQKVLELLEPQVRKRLKKAQQPLVHPNLVHNENTLATVQADVAQCAIDWMRTYNQQPITIADGSYHGTQSAFANFGYVALTKKDDSIRLLDVNQDNSVEVPFYQPNGGLDKAQYSQTIARADFRLTLAKAKTHSYYIMTAAMKTTAYGSVLGQPLDYWRMPGQKTIYSRSSWFHKDYHAGHKSLARLYGMYPAHAVVIEGTVAMQGDGPTNGDPVELGWVLGSTNAVAADAICAYLMGFEPTQIGYLVYAGQTAQGSYAHEAALGPIDLEKINIIGPNNWQTLRKKVIPPSNFDELLGWQR